MQLAEASLGLDARPEPIMHKLNVFEDQLKGHIKAPLSRWLEEEAMQ